ncbi:MAG TPA: DUF6266 family protein, partial [Chitinophagaceae bacterium]
LISGINGHIQGRIGTVIGSSWKGKPYVKGPYKKRTGKAGLGEAGNRNKFADAQFWLKPLLKFVRVGFNGYAERVEGFCAAKSLLLRNAFEGVQPDISINPSLVKVSFGELPLSDSIAVSKTAPGQLAFTWNPAAVADGNAKDQVMMLAYDVEHAKAHFTTLGQFRKDGGDVLHTDPTPGKTWHIYCAFIAADRSRQSESTYLGTITM